MKDVKNKLNELWKKGTTRFRKVLRKVRWA
jgi:hypothetical protein